MTNTAIRVGVDRPEGGVAQQRAGDGEAGDLGREPGEAFEICGRDGARRAPAEGSARMIVERASPVLVVKTVLSVLDGAAEAAARTA